MKQLNNEDIEEYRFEVASLKKDCRYKKNSRDIMEYDLYIVVAEIFEFRSLIILLELFVRLLGTQN